MNPNDITNPLNPASPVSPLNPSNPIWDDDTSEKVADATTTMSGEEMFILVLGCLLILSIIICILEK
jgi:hypothetical protein